MIGCLHERLHVRRSLRVGSSLHPALSTQKAISSLQRRLQRRATPASTRAAMLNARRKTTTQIADFFIRGVSRAVSLPDAGSKAHDVPLVRSYSGPFGQAPCTYARELHPFEQWEDAEPQNSVSHMA